VKELVIKSYYSLEKQPKSVNRLRAWLKKGLLLGNPRSELNEQDFSCTSLSFNVVHNVFDGIV